MTSPLTPAGPVEAAQLVPVRRFCGEISLSLASVMIPDCFPTVRVSTGHVVGDQAEITYSAVIVLT